MNPGADVWGHAASTHRAGASLHGTDPSRTLASVASTSKAFRVTK